MRSDNAAGTESEGIGEMEVCRLDDTSTGTQRGGLEARCYIPKS